MKPARLSLLALVIATLCISVLPSVQATDHTEWGYEDTDVYTISVTATATGPSNHSLDVVDADNVIVNVTCDYVDHRTLPINSAPAFHYFNVTVTYQSESRYDDENVTTYYLPDSGTTYLEVSFQVVEITTLYVYEYVNVALTGTMYQDFKEDWHNWTVTLF